MAWSAEKNAIFFQRAQNWAASLMNLLEERQRLIDQYNNEAAPGGSDDPAFIDFPAICTKAELVNLATNVMNPLNLLMTNQSVNGLQRNRIPDLTPLLTNQQ